MRTRDSYIWLSLCSVLLLGSVIGCEPKIKVIPPDAPVAATPPPPEKIKVVVLRLENATRRERADVGAGDDRLLGNGIKAQLVKALEQTERFTIVNNSGPREVLQRGTITATGEISERVKERLGSLGEAELIIAGALTSYQLSKESKEAGVEADLMFRETQARTVALDGIVETAKRAFNNTRLAGLDRVALELWIFDAKTGKRIASTTIEGMQSDTGETIGGQFGQKLATAASETTTPMQRSVRGGAIKAANWIADTQAAFRAGTLAPPPAPPVVRRPAESAPSPRIVAPSPARPPRPARGPASVKEAEKSPPVTAAPAPPPRQDDWGSPAPKPIKGAGKAPAQEDEWGEK